MPMSSASDGEIEHESMMAVGPKPAFKKVMHDRN
jgi:hypothetical protein